MLIGAALGWLNPPLGAALQPLGDAFIKAIRVLIAPLIFCTVVTGIAQISSTARVGRLALKALLYFELMTTVALILGLAMVNWLRPGVGMNVDLSQVNTALLDPYLKQASAAGGGVIAFLTNIIPSTFIGAFVEGNILQVLFVSILSGFALSVVGERGRPLLQVIESGSNMIFAAVGLVMWAAPLGAFGAIAFTVGKFGVGSLASLGILVADFYVTCLIFIIVVLGIVAAACGFNLFKLVRYLREEILVCIATTSSEVVLPRLIAKMKNAGCDAGIVDLVVRPAILSTWTAPASIWRRLRFFSRRPPMSRCPSRSRSACSWCFSSPRRALPEFPAPRSSCSPRRCPRIRRFRSRASP